MSTADWTVHPLSGLGRLVFGMPATEVEALSAVYGAVHGQVQDRIPDAILRETLEMFGDAMSQDEKDALLAMYADTAPPESAATEVRGDPVLVLSYERDRLAALTVSAGGRPLVLDGDDLFAMPTADAIEALSARNGGSGRFESTTARFDALGISLEGFTVADESGAVRMLDATDERFRERTVTLRPHPGPDPVSAR